MATVSLKQDEIEAIRYAADMMRTAAEGADQHVYDQMPLAALERAERKLRTAAQRRRRGATGGEGEPS